jgi:class 3 adenylate cyclase
MALLEDLATTVTGLARTHWGNIPNARVVPDPAALTLGNTGARMDVCILYADVHRSTEMVNVLSDTLAAEYYKAFLHCCAKLIRKNDGDIEAYDGDRVMAIFTGDNQAENAVNTAFEIHYAILQVINPSFLQIYAGLHRPLKHTVGIDCGQVLVAKTGVRNDNDFVWVGAAANYASKLNSFEGLDIDYPTRVTQAVIDKLPVDLRQMLVPPTAIWEGPYNDLKHRAHFRSNFWRSFT